jgi:hypothetical protein
MQIVLAMRNWGFYLAHREGSLRLLSANTVHSRLYGERVKSSPKATFLFSPDTEGLRQ